jgi:ubiquitin C-terminal hydrolase
MTTLPRHGLANIGNTCYLNSAIQALRHAAPFAAYFGTEAWRAHEHKERKDANLATEVAALVTELDSDGTKPLVPHKFVTAFIKAAHNDEIRLGVQADAAEALQILLDALHTQQARAVNMMIKGLRTEPKYTEYTKSLQAWSTFFQKEYSPLVENFYGQTQTRVVCGACAAVSTRYEPWSILKLPIPGAETAGAPAPTLQTCFREQFAKEVLEDYACDKCETRGRSDICHAISRMPAQLIVSLKRFTNRGAKVHARIPYDPDSVDLAELLAWPHIQGVCTAHYRVYATIEHIGSSRAGHYYMRARQPDDTWLVYDDERVTVSPNGGTANPDTYILFLAK